ncbi:MAG TPA: hypothetical protein VFH91_05470 [Pyrinomonadaceae bacterium]|nr:hypothetical protein [Pyrinomonadaceae bacterium]
MFGRQVTMKLKPGSGSEFIRINQTLVKTILREQQGFLSETTHINPEHSEVTANSLWNTKEDEVRYDETAYLEIVKALADVVEGTPMVKTFELAQTYFHKIAA